MGFGRRDGGVRLNLACRKDQNRTIIPQVSRNFAQYTTVIGLARANEKQITAGVWERS
jgi:hypothetical protein